MSTLTYNKALTIVDLAVNAARDTSSVLTGNNGAGIGKYRFNKTELAYKIDEGTAVTALGTVLCTASTVRFGIVIDDSVTDDQAKYLYIPYLSLQLGMKTSSPQATSVTVQFSICKVNPAYNSNTNSSYLISIKQLASITKSVSSTAVFARGMCSNLLIDIKNSWTVISSSSLTLT